MTYRSTSTITILDLLCEGPIQGFATPLKKGVSTSVLLNDNPATFQNSDSEDADVEVKLMLGASGQTLNSQFKEAKSTEIITINEEIGSNYSETLNAKNTVARVRKIRKPFARKIQILTVGEQRAKVMKKNKIADIFAKGKDKIRKDHNRIA